MTSDDPFDDLPGELAEADRLFNTAGPWTMRTSMTWDFLRDYRYVVGFQRAAEVLTNHLAHARHDVDALTMPILFCYRQWLELRLKDLWLEGSRLQRSDVEPLRTHRLDVLWRHVRPIFEEVWPEGNRSELDQLERLLHELAELDGPTGTGFRYATGKDDEPSLPNDLEINLYNVGVVMAKISTLLDGAASAIAEYLDYQREMDSYYGEG